MASEQQLKASRNLLLAVDALNKAMEEMARVGVTFELSEVSNVGRGANGYVVSSLKVCQNIMPEVARFEAEQMKHGKELAG